MDFFLTFKIFYFVQTLESVSLNPKKPMTFLGKKLGKKNFIQLNESRGPAYKLKRKYLSVSFCVTSVRLGKCNCVTPVAVLNNNTA